MCKGAKAFLLRALFLAGEEDRGAGCCGQCSACSKGWASPVPGLTAVSAVVLSAGFSVMGCVAAGFVVSGAVVVGLVVAGAVVGALMETLAFSVLTVSIRSVSVPSGV